MRDCSVCTAEASSAPTSAGGGAVVFFSFGVVPFAFSGSASFALGIFSTFGAGHRGQYMYWTGDGMLSM